VTFAEYQTWQHGTLDEALAKLEAYNKKITPVYERAVRKAKVEILSAFDQYGIKEFADWNKYLGKADMSELLTDLKAFAARESPLSATLDKRYMKLYATTIKAGKSTAGNALNLRISEIVRELDESKLEYFADDLADIWESATFRTAFALDSYFIIKAFTRPNAALINEATARTWRSLGYDRWFNVRDEQTLETIDKVLRRGVALGQNPKIIGRDLAEALDTDRKSSVRLARSLFADTANAATLHGYGEHGIDKYKYLATLSERTCETCGALDGKVFNRSDAEPGINYPIMHPNCRCTTTAYFEDDEPSDIGRIAYEPGKGQGGRYTVPADTTYAEWRAGLVDENGKWKYKNGA
jgi:SPP1 gp7 family putative phage head morphogenesis protein